MQPTVVRVVKVGAVPKALPRRWVRRDEVHIEIGERGLVALRGELVVGKQLLLQNLLDSLDLLRRVVVVRLQKRGRVKQCEA
jgi:hypothetical protein